MNQWPVAEGVIVIEVRIMIAVRALVQMEHMYHGREHWKNFSVQYTPKEVFYSFLYWKPHEGISPHMYVDKEKADNK